MHVHIICGCVDCRYVAGCIYLVVHKWGAIVAAKNTVLLRYKIRTPSHTDLIISRHPSHAEETIKL